MEKANVAILAGIPSALADNDGGYCGSWQWCSNIMGMGGGSVGGLLMLLFWVLVIVVVINLVKSMVSGGGGEEVKREKNALAILEERYAKGEIDKDEFERKKKDLTGEKQAD